MKKCLVFINLFVITAFSQPVQINNFDELYNSLVGGEDVNVVIKYSKTKLIIDGRENEAPDAIGGMELSNYEYFAAGVVRNDKAYISTSETVLISHPFYGFVYNYVKLKIYEDNTVEIIAQYLDPNSYEVKMDETFIGKINDSKNDGGVYFYKN